jgi:hypothetical protein
VHKEAGAALAQPREREQTQHDVADHLLAPHEGGTDGRDRGLEKELRVSNGS